jgi:hypothetical protein
MMSYALPNQYDDAYGIKEARELCEGVNWGKDGRMFGHMGKCGVCGAVYRYGDIWQHIPTGHLLHVGHDCADKYSMLADREDFNAALESIKRRRAAVIQAEHNRIIRANFLTANPGLEEALAVDHYILRDMNDKLNQYHALSEKQVAFAFKLAKEVQEKALMPAEVMIAAPIGKERTTIRGRLISRKAHESQFGIVLRMTVKVETDAGNWLCNGTCPNELYATNGEVQIGCFVQFDAMLVPGREPHFAFFKRPTQARVISEEEYRKPLVVVEKVKGKRAKKDKTDLVVIDLDD